MTNDSDSKRGPSNRTLIIIALIGLTGTICAACIAAIFTSRTIQCWLQPYTCSSPSPTVTPFPILTSSLVPTISVLGYPTDTNFAPYDVLISGIVSNADGKYLYLIVVDSGGVKWVQPPLGLITGDRFPFSGHAFLGASKDDPLAQNKTFIVYVAVSDNPSYKRDDHPTNEPMSAISEPINLVRRDHATP